jgi:hypothetical protein
VSGRAQGWYRDPFGIHEDRYFSEGWPTKLVRDDGTESYDLPPDQDFDEAELKGVPEADLTGRLGNSDLRRADEACDDPPYDAKMARDAAIERVWIRGVG